MNFTRANDLKPYLGRLFEWEELGGKGNMIRSGKLTDIYRGQLCFDNSEDLMPLSSYVNLQLKEN